MKTRTQTRSNYSARSWLAATLLAASVAVGGAGCKNPDAILIRATADEAVEQIEIYVRDDATGQIVFDSGWTPTTRAGETTRDISKKALKVALKLSEKGAFTLLIVGVIGQTDGNKPAVGSKQFFWAGRVKVTGTEEVRAHLYGVPAGQDADRDLWPSGATWLTSTPAAAAEFATKMDLLDCYDATADMPKPTSTGKTVDAAKINPFATEICGDGVDEACNGDTDEKCVDNDGDGDPSGSDCDDNNPARHNATAADPYPDPANCCGYSLGFLKGTPEGNKSYVGDPMLCPTVRCGDGIDNSCKGIENVAANDTKCVIDADCDGFSPPADCDDNDPNTYPGAPEPCGGTKDLNCSGKANDGCLPCDLDGDGYQRNDATNGCPNADDKNPGKFDCNDYDSSVFPGASTAVLPTRTIGLGGTEAGGTAEQHIESARRGYCRRYYETTTVIGTPRVAAFSQTAGDFDCDGNAYSGCPSVACDADGDGFPNSGAGCAISGIPVDCNDNDPTIFPGAPDKCGDSILQDCFQDKPCTGDTDGDGYVGTDDCAEGDPNRHPFATELCNGLDDDCDGLVDEGNPDGTGKPLVESDKVMSCTDSNIGECGKKVGACVCSAASANSTKDPGGMMDACPTELTATGNSKDKCFGAGQPQKQSCNPLDPKDDDCDGRVDAPDGKNLAILNQSCGTDVGECTVGQIIGCDMSKTNCFASLPTPENAWIVCSTDAICPKAELCNGKDDNCDGALPTDEQDLDGDKYLACGTAGCDTSGLASGLMGCGDCLDTGTAAGSSGAVAASSIHPTAPDDCEGVDNNCNGNADEGATCPAGSNGAPGGHDACCPNPGGYKCRDLRAASELNNCTSCGTVCDLAKSDRCSATGCVCGTTGAQCSGNDQCTTVSTDTRCRRPQGSDCSTGNECLSGNCTDGKCCESACTGQCERCDATPGTCTQTSGAPVNNKGTSRSACTDTDSDGCDGTCSTSRSACTYPNNATTCGNATCNGTNASFAAPLCDGAGQCNAAVSSSCGNYLCNNGTGLCRATCTMDSECASTAYCKRGAGVTSPTGTCQPKKNQGDACNPATTQGGDCQQGACAMCNSLGGCVDGRCCNDTCTTACRTCNGAMPGTCTLITSGEDPGTCTGTNDCRSDGNCRKDTGQSCSADDECVTSQCECTAAGCAGGTKNCCATNCVQACLAVGSGVPAQVTGVECSGGTCDTTVLCTPYTTCNGTACATTCSSNSDCVTGYHCNGINCIGNCNSDADCPGEYCDKASGGTCTPRKAPQTACSTASDCKSGTCLECSDGAGGGLACASNNLCPCLTDANCSSGFYCDDNTIAAGSCVAQVPANTACNNTRCKGGTTCLMCEGGYQCTTGTCPCIDDGDCASNQWCNASTDPDACASDLTPGSDCARPEQCTTNICGSGATKRCCAAACSGPCVTGACLATAGACEAAAANTVCNTTFVCGGGTTCPANCTSDTQCAPGYYCGKDAGSNGQCKARIADGAVCNSGDCEGAPCQICIDGARTCKNNMGTDRCEL